MNAWNAWISFDVGLANSFFTVSVILSFYQVGNFSYLSNKASRKYFFKNSSSVTSMEGSLALFLEQSYRQIMISIIMQA